MDFNSYKAPSAPVDPEWDPLFTAPFEYNSSTSILDDALAQCPLNAWSSSTGDWAVDTSMLVDSAVTSPTGPVHCLDGPMATCSLPSTSDAGSTTDIGFPQQPAFSAQSPPGLMEEREISDQASGAVPEASNLRDCTTWGYDNATTLSRYVTR